MAKLTVNDLDVRGKRVFVRVDYNVPMEEKDGQMVINDVTRIKETLPTLELLINKGARIILAAHLGRPKGQREPSMSLRPVAAKLADMIHRPVAFVDDCIGEKVENQPDKEFGSWVSEFYKSVASSGQPRYDRVTALVQYQEETGRPRRAVRYERLLLPWRTPTDEIFVTLSKLVESRPGSSKAPLNPALAGGKSSAAMKAARSS